MACPTCNHTLELLTQDIKNEVRYFLCPRCGTVVMDEKRLDTTTIRQSFVPKLVERVREYEAGLPWRQRPQESLWLSGDFRMSPPARTAPGGTQVNDQSTDFSGSVTILSGPVVRLQEQRDKLLAACQQVKDWLQLNNRTESVLYAPLCAVIAEVENTSPF